MRYRKTGNYLHKGIEIVATEVVNDPLRPCKKCKEEPRKEKSQFCKKCSSKYAQVQMNNRFLESKKTNEQ